MQPDNLYDMPVLDSNGGKIGKVTGVFADLETNKPEWASVSTGMFGSKEALVPLAAARQTGDGLVVPFDKARVKGAPHHDPDAEISAEHEAELFDYYGIPYGGETVTATGGPVGGDQAPANYDSPGQVTDNAMTRSEEQLQVGTQQVEVGRARLRKYVVTEQVTQTVPVSHEEVRLEREPITEANAGGAMDGPPITEQEHEVVLHAERPVVQKEAVPVERVRLGTQTVTEDAQVNESVRKEQIETDGVDTL
jgi:uncharacterized protein (TIGR02271 family)